MFRIIDGFRNNFLESQAAIWKPEQTYWRGLLEGLLEIVGDFIEASINFIFNFLHKRKPKIVKNISAYAKNSFLNTFPFNWIYETPYSICLVFIWWWFN